MRKYSPSVPLEEVFAQSQKDPSWKALYEKADLDMRVSLQIVRARERAGLTQGQLAKAIGTTQSVVSRIEGADQNLTVTTLHKIARALSCELVLELHASAGSEKREAASQVKDAPARAGRKRKGHRNY